MEKYYEVYAEKSDMTFVMVDMGECRPPECAGYYFGEPSEDNSLDVLASR